MLNCWCLLCVCFKTAAEFIPSFVKCVIGSLGVSLFRVYDVTVVLRGGCEEEVVQILLVTCDLLVAVLFGWYVWSLWFKLYWVFLPRLCADVDVTIGVQPILRGRLYSAADAQASAQRCLPTNSGFSCHFIAAVISVERYECYFRRVCTVDCAFVCDVGVLWLNS